ncbi:dienelactone hydrolase family protein [Anaeromicropila herbilytica]|uniref:Hydrolase n=1 Tax=Anaeromicropila herbilytica TaxID=2785025 RepID=A0A7R7EL85_9FIRM|nr:dienelactone hydrolase family protein [Anaeromicropila herbilytica]BCN30823.1 hydrolase [Anaeromicropila herbilytica]
MNRTCNNNRQAIIVLHEIYGVNEFITYQCEKFREAGFDVFSPNMIDKLPFTYEEVEEAYNYFMKNVGFEIYQEINNLVNQLKENYDKVFIIGFSVGATIAWRCCENAFCSGIVACYGSRIRDYTHLNPNCSTLLLFAKEDSFDVHAVTRQLQDKSNLSIIEFDAEHGFMDSYSKNYNIQQAKCAQEALKQFINKYAIIQ